MTENQKWLLQVEISRRFFNVEISGRFSNEDTGSMTENQKWQLQEVPGDLSLETVQTDLLAPLAQLVARTVQDMLERGELEIVTDESGCGIIVAPLDRHTHGAGTLASIKENEQ